MRPKIIFAFALFLFRSSVFAQTIPKPVQASEMNDFAPTLAFLSSDWMEGRETGKNGSLMAADYIVSMMQFIGLEPFGKKIVSQGAGNQDQSYFQDFELLSYKTEDASISIRNSKSKKHSSIRQISGSDFETTNCFNNLQAEVPMVFAGYGISAADKGYDDYKGLEAKGKVALILKGFPGHADVASPGWGKFGDPAAWEGTSLETKLLTARQHGAIAVLLVYANGKIGARSKQKMQENSIPVNPDAEYYLPGNAAFSTIPCFKLDSYPTSQLLAGTGIDLSAFEKNTARTVIPASRQLKDKLIKILVVVKKETIPVRNLLGIIPGKDTTQSVIIGAHFDHIGKRNGLIYNGADDNASGVAGMLAIARQWMESGIQPPCNLVFAAWAAEEKGLLGSEYFAQCLDKQPENILLYFNLDMISRSESSDTVRRKLSIGTRTSDENLREIAQNSNVLPNHPFELDLWDVTGHSGSDYASFAAKNIPVMTFNSGLHDDYHTPRDIAARVDFGKMADVLKVINACLWEFLESQP